MAWLCVGLGVMLGIAMLYWPYGRDCGWAVVSSTSSAGMVVIAGVWGLLISWKSRLGFAHTVALATMLWGVTLTAEAVLPRVGYAKIAQAWTCPVTPGE